MTRALRVHDGQKWFTVPETAGKVKVFDGHAWQNMKIVREYDGSHWVTTWELGGVVHPPVSHTVTVRGTKSHGHWVFNLTRYKGHITHTVLTIHARSVWSGSVSGYPVGGTLASGIHIPAGGGSATRTVSAAKFNTTTNGITLHHTLGTDAAVDRVSLKVTYTT